MAIMMVVFAIFSLLAYSTVLGIIRLVDIESTIIDMDQQANRSMEEITELIRPAILPIAIDSAKKSRKTIYDMVQTQFDNADGDAWRSSLRSGMDCIAFIVPADVDGDGDTVLGALDTGFFIETGFIDKKGNVAESTSETLANLVSINPMALNGISQENVNWRAVGATDPGENVFICIRFVPMVGANATVDEAILNYDLDGNGSVDDIFNIGRMQVIYANKTGDSVSYINGPMVLQNVDPGRRTPVFQLSDYSTTSIRNNGTMGADTTKGQMTLNIKLLLYDSQGQASKGMTFQNERPIKALSRWHETAVTLRNMSR